MEPPRQEPSEPLTIPIRRGSASSPSAEGAAAEDPNKAPPAAPAETTEEPEITTLSIRRGQTLRVSGEMQGLEPPPPPSVEGPPPETPAPVQAAPAVDDDIPEVRTISLRAGRRVIDQLGVPMPVARLASEPAPPPPAPASGRARPSNPPPVPADPEELLGITPPPAPSRFDIQVEVPEEDAGEDIPTAQAPANCPNCETRLIDPASLGMCPNCGYCRLLEETRARAHLLKKEPKKKVSMLGLVEFVELMGRVPSWLLILVGGLAAITAITVFGNYLLPDDSPQRTLWSTIQLVSGLIVLFAAQLWALGMVAPHEERIGPKDLVILSGRLWLVALRKLPATRWPIWLASWGLAAVVLDLVLIGALSTEFRLVTSWLPKKSPQGEASGSVIVSEAPAPAEGETAGNRLAVWANGIAQSLGGVTGWLVSELPWFDRQNPPPPENPQSPPGPAAQATAIVPIGPRAGV